MSAENTTSPATDDLAVRLDATPTTPPRKPRRRRYRPSAPAALNAERLAAFLAAEFAHTGHPDRGDLVAPYLDPARFADDDGTVSRERVREFVQALTGGAQ